MSFLAVTTHLLKSAEDQLGNNQVKLRHHQLELTRAWLGNNRANLKYHQLSLQMLKKPQNVKHRQLEGVLYYGGYSGLE